MTLPFTDQYILPHRGQQRPDRLDHRQEITVEDDDRGLGVVDCVDDLVGGQPPVGGLQHRSHHRDTEKAFEIAGAVIIEDRRDLARLQSQCGQPAGQPVDAVVEIAIGIALHTAVDNLLVGGVDQRRLQQFLDDEGVVVGLTASPESILYWRETNSRVYVSWLPAKKFTPDRAPAALWS